MGTDPDGCARWVATKCGAKDATVDVATQPPPCPTEVAGFVPSFEPPLAANVCTPQQIQEFWDACYGSAQSNVACNSFKSANAACMTCITTPATATSWGAIVEFSSQFGTYEFLNTGGCVALAENDASASSCGAKWSALAECESLACLHCSLPNDIDAAISQYFACVAAADQSVCSSYAAAQCDPDAGGFAQCASDAQANFINLATLFCAN